MTHRPRGWKRAIVIAVLAFSTAVLGLGAGRAHAGTTAPDVRLTSATADPNLGLTTGTSGPVAIGGVYPGWHCKDAGDGTPQCRLVQYYCPGNGDCYEL